MLKKISVLCVILSFVAPISGFSGTLQQLAVKFGKDMKDTDSKIAVMDFSTGEVGKNQDSNVVRERITTFLAQNKNITLIERSLLEKVFQEQKIQVSGAVGADTAKKIGELTGANAIVSGTLSELANDEIELNARIIEVGTGKVISAGQAVFKKDWKYYAPPALINEGKVVADSAQDYYRRGVQYHNDGKYNMALEFYSKAIKLKPDYLEAYYGRGTIYALMSSPVDEYLGIKSKYDEALADFNKAIDLKIDYAEAYFNRAMVYRAKTQYPNAISDLVKTMELTPVTTITAVGCFSSFMEVPSSPDYIGNYLLRGSVYEANGTPADFWSAIEDYNKVIAEFPACAYLYTLRGKVYKAFPNYPKAIADYSKAIELSTSTTANYIARGETYYAKGDYNSAIADYTSAIGLRNAQINIAIPSADIPKWEDGKPVDSAFVSRFVEDDSIYINRGNAYYMKADYPKAIADYSRAIELNTTPVDNLGEELGPGKSLAYANRGNVYLAKGEKEKAILDYTKAIELDPKYSSAYLNRGNAYSDKNEKDKAFDDYNKVISLAPQNADAYLQRGGIYYLRGINDKALADFNKGLELNSSSLYYQTFAYIYRADIHIQNNDPENALSDLNKAVSLSPKNALAYYDRGNLYFRKADYDRAISDYNSAINLEGRPDFACSIYRDRGNAYLIKGEHAKAIADCNTAIKLKPSFSDAYALCGEAYEAKGEHVKAKKAFKTSAELKNKIN